MFKRATKLKFNEQKYLQISTMRHQRIENTKVQSAGKRLALGFGLCTTFVVVKWRRKDPSHKPLYVPMRKGLNALPKHPVYQLMDEGGVKGFSPTSPGKPTLP